jgi:hypothetical protein
MAMAGFGTHNDLIRIHFPAKRFKGKDRIKDEG